MSESIKIYKDCPKALLHPDTKFQKFINNDHDNHLLEETFLSAIATLGEA